MDGYQVTRELSSLMGPSPKLAELLFQGAIPNLVELAGLYANSHRMHIGVVRGGLQGPSGHVYGYHAEKTTREITETTYRFMPSLLVFSVC